MERLVVRLAGTGEDDPEAEVVGWYVSNGDRVEERQPLVELRTGMTTRAVPAPASGRVVATRGDAGDTLSVGAELAVIEVERASGPPDRHAILMRPGGVGEHEEALKRPAPSFEDELAAIPLGVPPPLPTAPDPLALVEPVPTEPAESVEGADEATRSANDNASAAEEPVPAGTPEEQVVAVRSISEAGDDADGLPSWDLLEASLQRGIAEAIESLGLPQTPAVAEPAPAVPDPEIAEVAAAASEPQASDAAPISAAATAPRSQPSLFSYLEEVDVTALGDLLDHLNGRRGERPALTILSFLLLAVAKHRLLLPLPSAEGDGGLRIGLADGTAALPAAVTIDGAALDPWVCAGALLDARSEAEEGDLPAIAVLTLGELDGVAAVPPLVPPQFAALGLNRAVERPVVRHGQVVVRRLMNLSGSFDAGLVHPKAAAAFVRALRDALEYPVTLYVD